MDGTPRSHTHTQAARQIGGEAYLCPSEDDNDDSSSNLPELPVEEGDDEALEACTALRSAVEHGGHPCDMRAPVLALRERLQDSDRETPSLVNNLSKWLKYVDKLSLTGSRDWVPVACLLHHYRVWKTNQYSQRFSDFAAKAPIRVCTTDDGVVLGYSGARRRAAAAAATTTGMFEERCKDLPERTAASQPYDSADATRELQEVLGSLGPHLSSLRVPVVPVFHIAPPILVHWALCRGLPRHALPSLFAPEWESFEMAKCVNLLGWNPALKWATTITQGLDVQHREISTQCSAPGVAEFGPQGELLALQPLPLGRPQAAAGDLLRRWWGGESSL